MAKTTQKTTQKEMLLDVPTWANEGYKRARARRMREYIAKREERIMRREALCATVVGLVLAFVIFELMVYSKLGIWKWW